MGKYLDLARQIPRRAQPTPAVAEPPKREADSAGAHEELRNSLHRLISAGGGYIQITSKTDDVYIALTDSVFHDLAQRPGLTVYHAAHLIELTDEQIQELHERGKQLSPAGRSIEVKHVR